MLRLLLLCLVAAASIAAKVPLQVETCGYDSCTAAEPGVLNVHIVAHTHDDVGWLKTVDQYYYGSRNNIQKAGVQYILDSVVKELWADPKRRFIYVETAFFWKWWTRQDETVRKQVHVLVRQGRLQFVGGAWSMNDEAATHYQSTIDQFTWGLSKLNETFGPCGMPRVAWQIDPFGHSREFASLVASMGYDGLFLGRIDYEDKTHRLQTKTMEMVWRGDDDLGKPTDIFTGVLRNNYSPPPGFCFDVLCNDEPIIDDPNSPMYNVDIKIGDFLNYSLTQATHYRTSNVLLTMGGDFTYQDAGMWYKNLDKLIEHANLIAAHDNLNVKLFYSTPDCYLKAVKDAKPTLPIKQDDFFPYASDPTAFWTGYFTSRPTTKYFERQGNSFLQMVKQLQILAGLKEHNMFILNELKSALGIWQHHDAITGTEKQHVTSDYERILSDAVNDALIIVQQAFRKMMQGGSSPPFIFTTCHLNESRCDTSENSKQFVVTAYNHLAWYVNDSIRIPVVNGEYAVYAPNGDQIESQLVEIPSEILAVPTRISRATHELVFIAYLKPVSYKSFYVKTLKINKREIKKVGTKYLDMNYYWTGVNEPIANEAINVDYVGNKLNPNGEFHDVSGSKQNVRESIGYDLSMMLSDEPMIVQRHDEQFNEEIRLTHLDGTKFNIDLDFYYYPGAYGDNDGYSRRSSGAYILRPNATEPERIPKNITKSRPGPVVNETRFEIENGAGYIRFYKGLKYYEHDWVVGPIDVSDNVGKEYIVRYSTQSINNKGEFYTDSNGRQILKRKLNQRPQYNVTLAEHVPGNYYPVVNRIYIQDDKNKFSILTDRSEGGTSLLDGQIELMLHRRLLHDDAFGVGEALNEISASGMGLIARGTHRILITNPNDLSDKIEERKQVLQFHLQPQIFVADAAQVSLEQWMGLNKCYSWVNELPTGVHLLTVEPWHGQTLLLRLENYFEKDDQEVTTVEVNLKSIFKTLELKSFKETTLAANMWVEERQQWSWDMKGEFSESFNKEYGNEKPVNRAKDPVLARDNGFKIKLAAKQIRTFIVEYYHK